MTRELVHSGVAAPLTLKSALTVPGSGGFNLVVWGDASALGWPAIPLGSAIVVTVGRGTPQEAKYLVSGVTSTVTESTLAVPDWGRGYDGTTPTDLPMGTLVEHTISAFEMADLNDHILSTAAHGVTGEIADKDEVLPLTGGTITGNLTVTGNLGCSAPTADDHAATKNYADTRVKAGWVPIESFSGTMYVVWTVVALGTPPSGFTSWSVVANCRHIDPIEMDTPIPIQAWMEGNDLHLQIESAYSDDATGAFWQAVAY